MLTNLGTEECWEAFKNATLDSAREVYGEFIKKVT